MDRPGQTPSGKLNQARHWLIDRGVSVTCRFLFFSLAFCFLGEFFFFFFLLTRMDAEADPISDHPSHRSKLKKSPRVRVQTKIQMKRIEISPTFVTWCITSQFQSSENAKSHETVSSFKYSNRAKKKRLKKKIWIKTSFFRRERNRHWLSQVPMKYRNLQLKNKKRTNFKVQWSNWIHSSFFLLSHSFIYFILFLLFVLLSSVVGSSIIHGANILSWSYVVNVFVCCKRVVLNYKSRRDSLPLVAEASTSETVARQATERHFVRFERKKKYKNYDVLFGPLLLRRYENNNLFPLGWFSPWTISHHLFFFFELTRMDSFYVRPLPSVLAELIAEFDFLWRFTQLATQSLRHLFHYDIEFT